MSDVSCLAVRSRAPLPWSLRTARRPAPPSPARPKSCFNAQAGDVSAFRSCSWIEIAIAIAIAIRGESELTYTPDLAGRMT